MNLSDKTVTNMQFASVPTVRDMTLRDWFAGQALIGMANFVMEAAYADGQDPEDAIEVLSLSSYAIADAMMARRTK